jgi:ElaB/YqjD/DUF883 family membrane-anchored ribosome-binding protein
MRLAMSRQSSYAREFAEVERRMHHLEQRLDRLGSIASRTAANGVASAAQATERVSDALVSALGDVVDRFRGGARSVGSEASRFGQGAARFGHEASKLGSEALRRVSTEVERRPLMMIGVAIGVGLLIGWAGRRH